MTPYAAFLRAVNVGGSGRLPMADLRAMASDIGARRVETHIASGNLAFCHSGGPELIRAALEQALEHHAGRPVGVILRDLPQLDALLAANPFDSAPPNRVIALLTDMALPDRPEDEALNRIDEEIRAAPGALFIHYPSGQGGSRLALPAMKSGTARNLNTLRKMREMLAERAGGEKG